MPAVTSTDDDFKLCYAVMRLSSEKIRMADGAAFMGLKTGACRYRYNTLMKKLEAQFDTDDISAPGPAATGTAAPTKRRRVAGTAKGKTNNNGVKKEPDIATAADDEDDSTEEEQPAAKKAKTIAATKNAVPADGKTDAQVKVKNEEQGDGA